MNTFAEKHPWNHCLSFVFALFFIYSCGSGGGSDSSSTSESAALVFELQFQGSTDRASNHLARQAVDPDVCNDHLIQSVLVEVCQSSDDVVVASAERTCSAHGLSINNLPVGVNLYVVCKGFVGQHSVAGTGY